MTEPRAFTAETPVAPPSRAPDEALRDRIREQLGQFAANPVFRDAEADEVLIEGNPYRRPLRSNDIRFQDFSRPLRKEELTTNHALSANRALLNIYETDLVFLPAADQPEQWRDFARFYATESKVVGEQVRPALERHVFGFLDEEIRVSGNWSVAQVKEYLLQFNESCRDAGQPVVEAILASPETEKAAQMLLIQFAGDFLTEASPMARNILGSFGTAQVELFKIVSDEYGYGVYETKHSTLFERTLQSCGLQSSVHTYWQFYLATSLMLNNYFHYLSKDHSKYFRYLGALFFAEVSLKYATRAQSRLLTSVFGAGADTTYFDEHTHIDIHHSRMAFDRLIVPALERYGTRIIPELIRGVEELRLLQDIADADFLEQIHWMERLPRYREIAAAIYGRVQAGELDYPLETFLEGDGERSTTHVHDDHRLLVIESGEMDFWPGHPQAVRFRPGDTLLVPAHRLHGSVVVSEECYYHQPMIPQETIDAYPE